MEKYGLIFDMDGTLWNAAKEVAASWTKALAVAGYPEVIITEEDMYRTMGKTMDVIADLLLPFATGKEREDILRDCCLIENKDLRVTGAKLYPDLITTLQALKQKYHLYIVSNCQAGYIEAFLEYYKLEEMFDDFECFGNNNRPKADNIKLIYERNALTKAAYVGDTLGDYEATKEAGLTFIHAAYGFGEVEGVEKISSFAELPEVAGYVLV